MQDQGYILEDFSTPDNLFNIAGSWAITQGLGDITPNCLESNDIGDRESTTATFNTTLDGVFGIRHKVSSEGNYDFFTLAKNGTEILKTSGLPDSFTTTLIHVVAGDTIDLRFFKDGSLDKGRDAVAIERIFLYPPESYNLIDFSDGTKPDSFLGGWAVNADTSTDSGYSLSRGVTLEFQDALEIFKADSNVFCHFTYRLVADSRYETMNIALNGEPIYWKGGRHSASIYTVLAANDLLSFNLHNENGSCTAYLEKLYLFRDLEAGTPGGGTEPPQPPQESRVSGVVQIGGTVAARNVRAYGYDPVIQSIDGATVNLTKSLGQAISNTDTGEYNIELLAGYENEIFVVAFDDYGDPFTPEQTLNVGDRIHPTTPNGHVWETTGAGTLPVEEPTWIVDTETSQLYGTASMIARPFYRPMVHGPITPEVVEAP
jgi:hypothetical protein